MAVLLLMESGSSRPKLRKASLQSVHDILKKSRAGIKAADRDISNRKNPSCQYRVEKYSWKPFHAKKRADHTKIFHVSRTHPSKRKRDDKNGDASNKP